MSGSPFGKSAYVGLRVGRAPHCGARVTRLPSPARREPHATPEDRLQIPARGQTFAVTDGEGKSHRAAFFPGPREQPGTGRHLDRVAIVVRLQGFGPAGPAEFALR